MAPADALAALADGSVFVAYNTISRKLILDSDLRERRSRTHVRYITSLGAPDIEIRSPQAELRSLAFSPAKRLFGFITLQEEVLWAATSVGLFRAVRPRGASPTFQPWTSGTTSIPLDKVKINRRDVNCVGYYRSPIGGSSFVDWLQTRQRSVRRLNVEERHPRRPN